MLIRDATPDDLEGIFAIYDAEVLHGIATMERPPRPPSERSAWLCNHADPRHPAIVAAYPSYKAARLLKRLPGLPRLRRLMRRGADAAWLPIGARAFSLRLYRAALYADAV